MRPFLILVGFLLALAPFAVAGPIAGQDDPRFQAALEAWLADDEPVALPALAGLAAEGNRAAQVLLALIDRVPTYQGPWLVRLGRTERLALTRAPGGFSGRSWMAAAAADTPLAALWLQRDSPETTVESALALAGMGEDRAARETLQALAARQYRGFAAAAADPRYPPDLRHLVWREWAETPEGRAKAEAEIAALMPGDPQIRRFADRPVSQADTDDWLASAPLAAPLRATCDAFCPATPVTCRRAAYRLLSGMHDRLAEFGTPSETLIPPGRWHASPRGQKAIFRVPIARFTRAYVVSADTRAEDACLADGLAAEVAGFYGQPAVSPDGTPAPPR
jgi:hypothetical protein